jgi:hypothetical protein
LRSSLSHGTRFLLFGFVVASAGCSQAPGGGLNSGSFQAGKSLCTLHQFGDRIALAVWADQAQPDGAAAGEKGYIGGMRLSGNRQLDWNCETEDGKHGTVSFKLNGKSLSTDGKPYQLVVGPLFLITTRGEEVTIRQLNPDLSGVSPDKRGLAEGEAKLKALRESDNALKELLAPTAKE